MAEKDTVILARYRALDYVVNWNDKKYRWNGAVGKQIHRLTVPKDLFDHLSMNGCTITSGELVLEDENKDELLETFVFAPEELKNNTHTRDEVVKILDMPIAKMKKELEKINNEEEKRFILYVAKDVKLDSSSKRHALLEWMNIKDVAADDVFEE